MIGTRIDYWWKDLGRDKRKNREAEGKVLFESPGQASEATHGGSEETGNDFHKLSNEGGNDTQGAQRKPVATQKPEKTKNNSENNQALTNSPKDSIDNGQESPREHQSKEQKDRGPRSRQENNELIVENIQFQLALQNYQRRRFDESHKFQQGQDSNNDDMDAQFLFSHASEYREAGFQHPEERECGYNGRNDTSVISPAEIYRASKELRTAFERFIEKISEPTGYWNTRKPERYAPPLLIKRALDKRPLSKTRGTKEPDKVQLWIDTSGSMLDYSYILQVMTSIARKLHTIEIIEAPNGVPVRNFTTKEPLDEKYIEKVKNKTIIYIGDFDGGDSVYELAKRNRVYWIATEDRYWDTLDHSWNSHSIDEFHEVLEALWFAYTIYDFIGIFKEGRGAEQYAKNDEDWDDYDDYDNEDDYYYDDYEGY